MKKKKTYFKEDSQKVFQNRKDLEFVLEIPIDDLKQISHFLVEIDKYKYIKLQALQPQV